jgi:MFS family permease
LPARIVWLLALAVFINYVDRGNLATAAPLIKDELRLSNAQMGVLLSAFFWSYTPLQLLAGWLAHRLDVRYLYAAGLAVWSLATASMGLTTGFVSFLILRVAVGVGESVAFPCNAKLLADTASEQERGRANGLISVGLGLGPGFGTLVGGLIMARYGWRAGFLAFGLVSLLWLWPWLTATRGTVIDTPLRKARPIPYFTILRERAAWGTSLGHFCSNYGLYFVLTWLPLYLVKELGFTVAQMAIIGGIVYCVYAIAAAVTGWISDRLIDRGTSVSSVRKGIIVIGLSGVAVGMLLCSTAAASVSVFLLGIAAAFLGLVSPQLFAIAQTLGGPRAAGQWMGLQNTVGNFAGIVAPLATGWIVDRSGGYAWAFVLVAVVSVIGMVAWGLLIPRVQPIRWPDELAPHAPGMQRLR